jgi:hypothetical protein
MKHNILLAGLFLLSSTRFDKVRFPDLPSPTMGRGRTDVMNAHSASPAEEELPIVSA